MNWWKKIRSVISDGETKARYWCEACRREVPNPTTEAPPPGIEFPFYIRDSAGIHERSVRQACDDCWKRHRQLTPEGEAQYRRKHPVEAVCAALRDPGISVREDAARILSRLRDPRAVGPLIKAIQTEMRHVNAARAYLAEQLILTLADIGGAEAEQYLVRLLHTPSSWQPVPRYDFYPLVPATDWVMPALCHLGDIVMLRALFDLLAGHQPIRLRRNAAEELSRLAHSIGSSWSLPGAGQFEVTEAGRNMFVHGLRSALHDKDHSVQVNIARALQNLGEQ